MKTFINLRGLLTKRSDISKEFIHQKMNGVFIYFNSADINRRKFPLDSFKHIESFGNIEFKIKGLRCGKKALLSKTSGFNSMGNDNIGSYYIQCAIDDDDTNLIIILTDNTVRKNIRGFALISIKDDHMVLNIICVNKRPNVRTRSNINYGSGTMLIDIIMFLGKDFIKGIRTCSLDNIIPYYYNFGWRFIVNDRATERSHFKNVCHDLSAFFKKTRNNLNRENDKKELIRLLIPLRGFLEYRANIIRTGQAVGGEATELANGDGYQMLLPRSKNKWR